MISVSLHNEDDTPIAYNSIIMEVGVDDIRRLIDASQIYETLETLTWPASSITRSL